MLIYNLQLSLVLTWQSCAAYYFSLESSRLLAINSNFCYHAVHFLHFDTNILEDVFQISVQFNGACQLCIWRIVLPIPMNVCPALYYMSIVLGCCCNVSQMYDFFPLITALYFRVAFIQVSPRICFSTSAMKALAILFWYESTWFSFRCLMLMLLTWIWNQKSMF